MTDLAPSADLAPAGLAPADTTADATATKTSAPPRERVRFRAVWPSRRGLVRPPAGIASGEPSELPTATQPPAGRRMARLTAALLTLMVMSAGVFAYFERVATAAPPARYDITAPASPSWLEAPSPAAVGWFRAEVTLTSAPISAALTIDARDTYQVWVNGRSAGTNRTPARLGSLPTGGAVDVRSLLRSGANVIAVQVSGLGDSPAAMWASLQAETATGTVQLDTNGGAWKSTSDPALTGSMLGKESAFVQPAFAATGWAAPVRVPSIRQVQTTVPAALVGTVPALASSIRGFDAVYTLDATLPSTVQDSWLQVAATGAVTVSANGRLVSTEAAPEYQSPNSHRPAPLHLIHLGGQLHEGTNRLILHVTGGDSTAVAIGGIVRASSSAAWQSIGTSQVQWAGAAQGAAMAAAPLTPAAIKALWPNGFAATVSAEPPSLDWGAIAAAILPGWLLALLVMIGVTVALRRRVPAGVMMGRISLCLAPACAGVLAAYAFGRWITVTPGFAYRAPVVAAVIVLLVVPFAGLVVAVALRKWWPARPDSRPARTVVVQAVSAARLTYQRITSRVPAVVTTHRVFIVLIAAAAGLSQGWRIGRQPLWQDEVTSVAVAHGISQNGLPRLASGLFYFKAELYHGLLALIMSISDNPDVLRSVSLFWFVASVLAFGFLLMPALTASRHLQVIATAVLAVVPAELVWARDIRMYQQMQFFAIVFLALYIRALRDGRTRHIVGSGIALLAMYFSHEESFVMLPALPLMALACRRVVWSRWRPFLAVYVPAGLLIAGQYAVSHLHPVDFGEDLSNRPYVGWDPNQADFYYQKIFFSPIAQAGSMAVLSTLAIWGIVVGLRRRDTASNLLGIALVVTVIAMSLVLTAKVDRYSFVTIPALVALAVLGGANLVGRVWRSGLTSFRDRRYVRNWLRATVVATVVFAVFASLTTLVISPRGFGLWAADLTGTPNPLTHPDYAPTVTYLREHQQPGDQVITLAPPVMAAQYLGRSPDRVIQTGRNKLLYLVLRDGRAVETILGVPVLLTGEQIRVFLEAHRRVWLVSDAGSYIQGVPTDVRDEVSRDFQIVAQDAQTTVSLWNAG